MVPPPIYTTPGGESILRSLTAETAISNLPTAPRPPLPTPAAATTGAAAAAGSTVGAAGGVGTAGLGALAVPGAVVVGAGLAAALYELPPSQIQQNWEGMNPLMKKAFTQSWQFSMSGLDPETGLPKSGNFPPTGIVNGSGQEIKKGGSGPPPFTGGQGNDVSYLVEWAGQQPFGWGPLTGSAGVYGPIRDLAINNNSSTYYGGSATVSILAKLTAGGDYQTINIGPFLYGNGGFPEITGIRRADGLPDTDGDPPAADEDGSIVAPTVVPTGYGEGENQKIAPPAPALAPDPITIPDTPAAPATPVDPLTPGEGASAAESEDKKAPGLPAFPPLSIPPGVPVASGTEVGNPTKPDSWFIPPIIPPPAPPTSPPDCKCNAPLLNGQQGLSDKLDTLLAGAGAAEGAAILELLQTVASAVGVSGFPASVPANLAKPGGGTKSLGSLAEMGLWQTEQLDGLVGAYPQRTSVKLPNGGNIDLDQPNISESLAEIQGMLLGLTITSSEILHTSSRTLHQAGSATQQAHLAQLFARGNAEFLGYEGQKKAVDIPLAYTPGANPFEGFLSEGTKKVEGWEMSDQQDMKSILAELLQAAAIIRAVFWRQLDAKGDYRTQIKDLIKGQSKFVEEEGKRRGSDSDWEAYLTQVEQGFTQSTGGSAPYGRDATEAPKIRDLSKPDSQQ